MEVYQTMARSPGSAGKPYWEHTPSLGEGFIGRDHPIALSHLPSFSVPGILTQRGCG